MLMGLSFLSICCMLKLNPGKNILATFEVRNHNKKKNTQTRIKITRKIKLNLRSLNEQQEPNMLIQIENTGSLLLYLIPNCPYSLVSSDFEVEKWP